MKTARTRTCISGALCILVLIGILVPASAVAQEAPVATTSARGTTDTLRIDLARAESMALDGNPFLRAALRDVGVARGELRQASTYRFNPEVEYEAETVDPAPGASAFDRYEAVVAQEIEWAGQWGLRSDAAERGMDQAAFLADDARRQTLMEARIAFYHAEATARSMEVVQAIADLNRRLRDAVAAQLRAGEVSALDANLAEIEFGRARGRVLTAEREHESTLLALKEVTGVDPGVAVELEPVPMEAEDPSLPDPDALALDSLLRTALERRPDLRAAEAGVEGARILESLARREAIPNLRLLVPIRGRSLDTDPDIGVGMGLSIPLWNRNQGTRDARNAEIRQAEARRRGVRLRVRIQVGDALQSYRSASEAAATLRESVLGPGRQNRGLLEEAYRAGKLDLPSLLLLSNQLLNAELEYWDAWQARREALARLRAAVGERSEEQTEEER